MRWTLALTALLAVAATAEARDLPPLRDPVLLNIGMNCQWQQRCMTKQQKAMKRALAFVAKKRPAMWRVEQCNRNAGRTRSRVDWVGFDNCVRNSGLRYTPAAAKRTVTKPVRRISATGTASRSLGERG